MGERAVVDACYPSSIALFPHLLSCRPRRHRRWIQARQGARRHQLLPCRRRQRQGARGRGEEQGLEERGGLGLEGGGGWGLLLLLLEEEEEGAGREQGEGRRERGCASVCVGVGDLIDTRGMRGSIFRNCICIE